MSERCAERVFKEYRYHPCKRNAVKDGFCKQHHPDSVEARRKASEELYARKRERSPYTLLSKALEENARLKAERQWISVEDRLPEVGQLCMTLTRFETYSIDRFSTAMKFTADYPCHTEDPVTYWLPLPNPPEGE